jgi:hypothetical protein
MCSVLRMYTPIILFYEILPFKLYHCANINNTNSAGFPLVLYISWHVKFYTIKYWYSSACEIWIINCNWNHISKFCVDKFIYIGKALINSGPVYNSVFSRVLLEEATCQTVFCVCFAINFGRFHYLLIYRIFSLVENSQYSVLVKMLVTLCLFDTKQ